MRGVAARESGRGDKRMKGRGRVWEEKRKQEEGLLRTGLFRGQGLSFNILPLRRGRGTKNEKKGKDAGKALLVRGSGLARKYLETCLGFFVR